MSEDLSNIELGIVLVVGGRGFIGSWCIKDVLKNGATKVHTINSHLPTADQKIPNVTYHAVDLSDTAGILQTVQLVKPDVILHLASPRPFVESQDTYTRTNILGIQNIISACDAIGTVKAFVYCSSVSVIHDGVQDLRYADESWPVLTAPGQKEWYWHTKAIAEMLVLQHNRRNEYAGMLTTALRITAVFGPPPGDVMVIGSIIQQAKTGKLKVQIGEGKNLQDWTYVENVAEAHTHAARRLLRAHGHHPDPPERRVEGEAFFITNDDPRPFWGFMRQVAAKAGYPVDEAEVTKLPAFMADVIGFVSEYYVWMTSFGRRKSSMGRRVMRYTVIDQYFRVEKARRQLGYVPRIGIEEGIERSVAALKEE